MGGSWEAHGRLMGGSWDAHGKLMGGSWEAHGKFMGGSWATPIVHSFRIHYAELYSTSLTVSELPPTMVRFPCHAFDAVGKLTRKPMIQETCGALCSTGRPRQTDIFWRARKTPMHGAASSGQHHARAQASPAQVPLGAPEDSGAARPRTQ